MAEDTRWQEREPTSDAELYDMLRWMFGLGSYDEYDEPHEPYFKSRNVEIGKVKASRNKHKVSIPDAVLSARWCYTNGVRVKWVGDLWKHLAQAKAERDRGPSDLEKLISYAIERERALADAQSDDWISRLTRAQGQFRKEVVLEWQRSRIETTSA